MPGTEAQWSGAMAGAIRQGPGARKPPQYAAAREAATAAATAVRTYGHSMPYVNRFGPQVSGPSIKTISIENNKWVTADGEFAKYLGTGDGRRWLKSKAGKAWSSAQQAKKDEASKAAKDAKKATQTAVREAKKAQTASTPAGAKSAAKKAKKAATKSKKLVKKAQKATAAVKKSAKGGAKGKTAKASASKGKRKGKKGGGGGKRGGGKARKASARKRSGRGRISAAHRARMRAGLRRYWASQKKRGGAPARLRRKLSAAIKAHPPLSKAERAFRKTNPKRRRRRNPSALLVNPRRRNPAMKRRRRNPGLGGVAMQVMKTGGPALATAAALGALDVKFFSDKPKIVGVLAKLGVGVGALIGLRGKPQYAVPIACAAFASIGNDLGVKLAGGMVGGSRAATTKEMGQIAAEDEERFGLLLNEMQGLGILSVEGIGNPVDDAAAAFEGTEALDVGDF
jgi:hypothetical protein